MQAIFALAPKKIAVTLGGISGLLAVISITGKALEYGAGTTSTYTLYQVVRLFNINREGNLPTWYASTLLLISAALLAAIAQAKRANTDRYARHWTALALLFLFLAIDETASIHEKFTAPLQENLHLTGYLYFGWVIVGGIFLLVVGLAFLRFFLHLPVLTRRWVLGAALLYVGGALVIEAISANQWYLQDGTSLRYSAIGTIEELCEMLGIVVFIYALLTYSATFITGIQVTFAPKAGGP